MSELRPSWVPEAPPGADELPSEDGVPMETPKHRKQMNVLIDQIERAWADRDDFFVGGNMFLYFSELQTKKNDFRGPDFFIVLHTTHHDRKSWVVWQENGQTPDVVIELVSESTRDVDLGPKKDTYAYLLKVRDYFLFDPETGELTGFTMAPDGHYKELAPNDEGRLPSASIGLELGVIDWRFQGIGGRWLRWFEPNGEMLLIGDEQAQAERERAEVERQRADSLAAQLAAYETRFGKLEE